jgi:hypothetical protein
MYRNRPCPRHQPLFSWITAAIAVDYREFCLDTRASFEDCYATFSNRHAGASVVDLKFLNRRGNLVEELQIQKPH